MNVKYYRQFPIRIAYVPFWDKLTNLPRWNKIIGKCRPVVVLGEVKGMYKILKITSHFYDKKYQTRRYRLFIDYWKQHGLKYESFIDTSASVLIPNDCLVSLALTPKFKPFRHEESQKILKIFKQDAHASNEAGYHKYVKHSMLSTYHNHGINKYLNLNSNGCKKNNSEILKAFD